jgi:hypothetical protein
LDDALQRCLARERSQRYATVAEMRDAVIPAMQHFPAQGSPTAANELSTITITGKPERKAVAFSPQTPEPEGQGGHLE